MASRAVAEVSKSRVSHPDTALMKQLNNLVQRKSEQTGESIGKIWLSVLEPKSNMALQLASQLEECPCVQWAHDLSPIQKDIEALSDFMMNIYAAAHFYGHRVRSFADQVATYEKNFINPAIDELTKAATGAKHSSTVEGAEMKDDDALPNTAAGILCDENDAAMLRRPQKRHFDVFSQIAVRLKKNVKGSQTVASWKDLPSWMVKNILPKSKELLGCEYTPEQLRLMLIRGRHILRTRCSEIQSENSLPSWAEKLLDASDSKDDSSLGNMLFALYLYTTNNQLCSCKDAECCETVCKAEFAEAVAKATGSPLPSKAPKVHAKCRASPSNRAAHGPRTDFWALSNWSMRVAGDDTQSEEVRTEALQVVDVLQPFIKTLQNALRVLESSDSVVFRGITVNALPYHIDDVIHWPAFSSTSRDGSVAMSFMGKNQGGTFFIVHTHSSAGVGCLSWYPEQDELLIPSGVSFSVQNRMSNTLLSMLNSSCEIITMTELHGPKRTSHQQAERVVLGLAKTQFIYREFLSTYVEGWVSASPTNRKEGFSITTLLESLLQMAKWKSSTTKKTHFQKRVVMVGNGGTGKTSAILYLLSALMDRCTPENRVVPLFVPLAATNFVEANGVDEYLRNTLKLDTEAFETLLKEWRVIIMLDSLDEVASVQSSNDISGLLQRNPMIKVHATAIILSTRVEILHSHHVAPEQILPFDAAERIEIDQGKDRFATLEGQPESVGSSSEVLYLHLFDDEDISRYLSRNDMSTAETTIRDCGLWEQVRLPYSLFMFVSSLQPFVNTENPRAPLEKAHGLVSDSSTDALVPYGKTELYEAYIASHFEHACCLKDSDVMAAMFGASTVAVRMTMKGKSHDVVGNFPPSLVPADVFKVLPLRLEGFDDAATFCFRHKSLQEYFTARELYNNCLEESFNPSASITTIGSSIVQSFPNIISFFTDRLRRDSVRGQDVRRRLSQYVASAAALPSAASLALTLLVHSRTRIATFLPSLSKLHIKNAQLDFGDFSDVDLTDAKLENCSIRNLDLSNATVTRLDLSGSEAYERVPMQENGPCGQQMSSAGDVIATCDNSFSMVNLWNLSTTQKYATIPAHPAASEVHGMAISASGSLLAVGYASWGWGSPVCVYNLPSGDLVQQIDGGFQSCVKALRFSLDEKTVYCGDKDAISAWNVHGGSKVLSPVRLTDGYIYYISMNASGELLAVSTPGSNTVYIMKSDDFETISTLRLKCYRAVFSPTKNQLATTSTKGKDILIWDISDAENPTKQHVLKDGHIVDVYLFKFNSNGTTLISSTYEGGQITVWDIPSERVKKVLPPNGAPICSLDISADDEWAIHSDREGKIKQVRIVDEERGDIPGTTVGHGDAVTSLAASIVSPTFVTGGKDGVVKRWSTASHQEISSHNINSPVNCVAMSPTSDNIFACGNEAGSIVLFRNNSQTVFNVYKASVASMSFSSDGTLLATGGSDGTMRVIDAQSGAEQFRSTREKPLIAVAFSFKRDLSEHLVYSSLDGCVSMLSRDGLHQRDLRPPGTITTSAIAFSPADNNTLALGSSDFMVRIYALTDPTSDPDILTAHEAPVRTATFTSDGGRLVSGAEDTSVIIWSIATKSIERVLLAHYGPTTAVGVSPVVEMTQYLFTTGVDGTVRTWMLSKKESKTEASESIDVFRKNGNVSLALNDRHFMQTDGEWSIPENPTPDEAALITRVPVCSAKTAFAQLRSVGCKGPLRCRDAKDPSTIMNGGALPELLSQGCITADKKFLDALSGTTAFSTEMLRSIQCGHYPHGILTLRLKYESGEQQVFEGARHPPYAEDPPEVLASGEHIVSMRYWHYGYEGPELHGKLIELLLNTDRRILLGPEKDYESMSSKAPHFSFTVKEGRCISGLVVNEVTGYIQDVVQSTL